MQTQVIEQGDTHAFGACVLYIGGAFGYRRVECRAIAIKLGRYAQYDRALHVEYLEKGKRKGRAFVCYAFGRSEPDKPGSCTTLPFVVLESGARIDLPATFEQRRDGSAITRHTACSGQWDHEFHTALATSRATVFFDGRNGGR